jgi:hypothetical protein
VLICFGFAGNAQARRADDAQTGNEDRKYDQGNGVKLIDDGQTDDDGVSGRVRGREESRLYPAQWRYRRHEQEPTTEVAIRRTWPKISDAVLGGLISRISR